MKQHKSGKQKQRKLHKFYKTGVVSPNSGENVSSLIAETTNMGNGARDVLAEALNSFSDHINEPPWSFVDIVEPNDYFRAFRFQYKKDRRSPPGSRSQEETFSNR